MQMRPPSHLTAGSRRLPIYLLTNTQHLGKIVRELAAGRSAAFYSGLFHRVRVENRAGPTLDKMRRVTHQRSRFPAALPVYLAPPQTALAQIDAAQVHPAFRLPDRLIELYACVSAPLQVVVPVRSSPSTVGLRSLTAPTAIREVSTGTAIDDLAAVRQAGFLWMHDLNWALLAQLLTAGSVMGPLCTVNSLATPHYDPIFALQELADWAADQKEVPFDIIVHDTRLESSGAFSDQTRVRLPLRDEEPALHILRRGSVGASWLAEASGWPVVTAPDLPTGQRAAGLSDDDLRLRLCAGWQGW
jgi:hypothetical protein